MGAISRHEKYIRELNFSNAANELFSSSVRLIGLLIYKFIRIRLYLVNRYFIILIEVLLPETEISSS